MSTALALRATLLLCLSLAGAPAWALYGDARPDAPQLASRGPWPVGVRTQEVVNPGQVDVLASSAQAVRYDRPLRLEIWYPAQLGPNEREHTVYTDVFGAGANDAARPNTPFQFEGRAARDAAPAETERWPLVIVSHGYPGSRLQMSYLTEFLASHGYIVAAIDHTDSTRADKGLFASTLLNRPLDDLFILHCLTQWSAASAGHFLSGRVDTRRTALVGYSMGGYGVLRAAGARLTPAVAQWVPAERLAYLQAPAAQPPVDARIKALIAFAPWGGVQGLLDADSLAAIGTPMLLIAGDQDDVAGYEQGVKRLLRASRAADRYLLVYQNARHNIAPNPAPPAAVDRPAEFAAYAEPVWASERLNNLNQHFVLAFLDQTLKGQDRRAYLQDWQGFKPGGHLGLHIEHWPPAATSPSSPATGATP